MFLDEDILKIIFLMIHGEVYSCGDHMIRVTRGEPLQDPYGHKMGDLPMDRWEDSKCDDWNEAYCSATAPY